MTSITINKNWYNEIKTLVKTTNPYFYTENGVEMVEVDVDETAFDKASKEMGWMV